MALRTGDLLMKQFKQCPEYHPITDEDLKQLKKWLVYITTDIIRVFDKYNLKYFIGAGSALGAVRHQGFIPWDDDVDIHMPRKDYMKFLEVAENELGSQYSIKSVSKGDKVNYGTIHVILKDSIYVNYIDLAFGNTGKDAGLYVDIFPYDNASDIKLFRNIRGFFTLGIFFIISCIDVNKSIKYLKSLGMTFEKQDWKKLRLKNTVGKIFGVIPEYKYVKLNDKILSGYKDDDSKYITCYFGKHLNKFTHLRSNLYGDDNFGLFEGHRWKLPTNVDLYLSQEYSKDYMTPPVESKRKIHPVFGLEFPKNL